MLFGTSAVYCFGRRTVTTVRSGAAVIVSVPQVINGEATYDVKVYPKFSTASPEKPSPEAPTQPQKPDHPSQPVKPKLPQTGQLLWPIPVLLLSGILCFALGWVMRKRTEKQNEA